MGRIVMKDPTPPPGFFHYPGGYGGRACSVVISGTPIERPWGSYWNSKAQTTPGQPRSVVFGPSQQMDYEVELAAVVGRPLPMRQRVKAVDSDEHIFGFVILNDWSGTLISTCQPDHVHMLTGL